MLEDIIKERRKKLDELVRAGAEPYPARISAGVSVADFVKNFSKLVKSKSEQIVAGRIISLRDQGNILFADLLQDGAKLQVILKKENLPDYKFFSAVLDAGDFIEVKGTALKTKSGEKSIEAKSARFLVKSLRSLPRSWYGLRDVEERFRKRYLDLILNPEVKSRLLARSRVIKELRDSLFRSGFVEVETPILQPIPGGARAKPFRTHHNALDQDFYLRIAPELYLKRLLVGGFEKIFELGRVFRNEGIDREHNPEFTMLELYWAYQDYGGLMKFTEGLLKKYIPGKWEKITYSESFLKFAGKKIKDVPADEVDEIFKKEIRPKIEKPTLVIDYPKGISPLAKSSVKNPELAERFQLIVKGFEIVNAFSELNDPIEQRARMEEQEKRFRAGDLEASRLDEDFLEALEYGMPPAAGLGLGVDRLVSLVSQVPNVKEVIIFPTLRSKE